MTYFQKHAYRIGCGFAAFLWPFFGKRRRISVENILKCRITDDPSEALRIAKASWCHLAGHIAEALCVPNVVTRENWREHLDVSTLPPETVKLLLDTPDKPILLVSSHHGVWEAATNILSFARPMITVARTLNNRLVSVWMKKHHFRGPVTIIDKNHGMKPEFLRQWKQECAAMTLLVDQYAHKGPLLQFLGRPARTVTSAARMAIRAGAPVVIGSFVRLGPYRYRLVGGDYLSFATDADVNAAAQLMNDRLGAVIREYPEQYLWSHRRWRDD